ncbi:MAG: cytochrome P450 [Dehalococcoidia bacterium]
MTVKEKLQDSFQRVAARALTTVERVQTGAGWNPLDAGYLRDPYPTYRRLRERDPVHRSRLVQGALVLTRYDDIVSVLRDPNARADGRKHPEYPKQRARMEEARLIEPDEADAISMLTSDPPDHTRLRSLVSKAFTPRSVDSLRPRIEAIVHEHLDAVAANGRMDVIEDLAYPLPVIVIAEMLGVPASDRNQFKAWSDEIVLGLGISSLEDARRSRKAVRELQAYFARVAEERRREPREDLLSALVAAEDEGDRLTAAEVYQTCNLLLVAGHETTTNLIGNGLLALLRHPEQLELLRRDPSLIDGAVEEFLRYDSPVQATARFSAEGFQIDGHHAAPWQQVFLLLGAGNRDPAQFADPERLDVTRKDVKVLSFGHGIHYCLGAPLARIEGPIALRATIERFPNMRLATGRPEWNKNLILRGLKSLPITF